MRGSLEDLALADILHIVFLSKRTGILILTTEQGKSSVLFKNGRVVSVHASGQETPPLGEMLVQQGLLSKDMLDQVLATGDSRPLGVRLVELGIPHEQIEQSVRQQIMGVLQELLKIGEGTFAFELMENLPVDGLSAKEISLQDGIEPDDVLEAKEGYTPTALAMPFKMQPDDIHPDSAVEGAEHYAISTPAAPPPAAADEEEDLEVDFAMAESAPEAPAAPARSEEQVSPAPAPSVEPSPSKPGGAPVVLADDDALFRLHLEGVLLQRGYRVYAVESAEEAVRTAKTLCGQGELPVVVSDLLMRSSRGKGLLGGLEVLEEVKRIDAAVPVVMMTDHLDPKVRHEAYRLGVSNYLVKPDISEIEIADLEEDLQQFSEDIHYVVRRLVVRGGAAGELAPFPSPADAKMVSQAVTEATFSDAAKPSEKQLRAIRALVRELQDPTETTEISLLILRLAAEFFDRAILFLVKKDKVYGLGGFGETGDKESINDKVRRIQVDRHADSVFRKIIESRQTHRGKLKDTMNNRLLIENLGKRAPTEIVVVPLVSRRRVLAALYGDNAHHHKPLGNIEGLEIFMSQAGIAMENAILHRQLQARA
jgi:CheY-like chemotaxis protein